MKKILLPALAVLAIVGAPAAYARTMHASGSWNVLSDANNDTCYVANRGATNGEVKISGPFATAAGASAAMGSAVQCAVPENSD